MASGIITFTSDYGWEDEFVGVCHGVMLSITRDLRIVDLHHSIARHDVRHGAVVLEQSVPYMPDAVHLAVVDPSVGSERRAIAVETSWGAVLVGPDNGLLLPAADACGGITAAYSLEDTRYLLSPVSRTFQGRDVFAPATAHLASGVPAAELGPAAEISSLVRLEIPEAWEHDDHLHAGSFRSIASGTCSSTSTALGSRRSVCRNARLWRFASKGTGCRSTTAPPSPTFPPATSCWWRTPTSTSPWRLTRVTRAPSCGPRRARR